MPPHRELHWPTRTLIYALIVMDVLILFTNLGAGTSDVQANLSAVVGWAGVLAAVIAYDVMVERLPPPRSGQLLDLALILIGAGAYALLQTSVVLFIFRGMALTQPWSSDPVLWMVSLMLALSAIGLHLYRFR